MLKAVAVSMHITGHIWHITRPHNRLQKAGRTTFTEKAATETPKFGIKSNFAAVSQVILSSRFRPFCRLPTMDRDTFAAICIEKIKNVQSRKIKLDFWLEWMDVDRGWIQNWIVCGVS